MTMSEPPHRDSSNLLEFLVDPVPDVGQWLCFALAESEKGGKDSPVGPNGSVVAPIE
jgi:hypothetical protein